MTRSGRAFCAAAVLAAAPAACSSRACPPPAPGIAESVEAFGLSVEAARALAAGNVALKGRARAAALCRRGRDEDLCREARRLEVEVGHRGLLEAARVAEAAHLDWVSALDLAAGCRSAREETDRCREVVPQLLADRSASALAAARELSKQARCLSAGKPP